MLDKETFVSLIDEKSSAIYKTAWAILKNKEDCSDALQEAVLKAWAHRHTLRDESFFGTWLTRIVINECKNIKRKQAKYVFQEEVKNTNISNSPYDNHYELIEGMDIHSAIDALPEKLRLSFVLHYVQGYSLKEIANILRLPTNTVSNRLFRARQQLRMDLIQGEGVRA